ncbi:MAG: hypothetical protein LBB78_10485 [Spirochaetaceae bacterium]|jgi:hypothetical protein|nr:hypothetical protein [Spirochaetaceae bacterium]
MAIIEVSTGIIRGKLGNIVFIYRMGTNYAQKYVAHKPPATEKQAAHRRLYAQLQGLGSLWLRDLIKPNYSGDPALQSPYRQFIKYNWAHWDKVVSAWTVALPFWGYGIPPVMVVDAESVTGNVIVDLFPPAPLSLSDCAPRFMRVLKQDLNWVDIPAYETLPDQHRVILPDAPGYKAGAWNMMAWYTGPADQKPLADPIRG